MVPWPVQSAKKEEVKRFSSLVLTSRTRTAVILSPFVSTPKAWWDGRSSDFPFLYELFKLVYWHPASSSGVERLFSVTGRICRAHRSRLDPILIERLTLVKLAVPK